MKPTRVAGWTVAVLLLAGCANIDRSSRAAFGRQDVVGTAGTPEEHLHVSNYGYYLFNAVPLFCGSTDVPGSGAFFEDTVRLDQTQELLMRTAKSRGAVQVADIQAIPHSTCFFSAIPYVGNTLGLVWYREVQMSAVLVRPAAPGMAVRK